MNVLSKDQLWRCFLHKEATMNDKGSILIRDRGHFITMDEWRRRKRERRERDTRLKWSLIGVGFILATMYLLYRLDDVARWVAGG